MSKNFELSKNQIRHFHDFGYLIIRDFYDLNIIREVLEEIISDHSSVLKKLNNYLQIDIEKQFDVGIENNSIKYLKDANFWFNSINKLTSLKLKLLIRSISKMDLYLRRIELHQKFPGVSITPPHQDNFYFGLDLSKNYALTAYIALNEQSNIHGVLGVYPGSHKKNFEHHPSNITAFSSGLKQSDIKYELLLPDLMPGDVIIHHCNIIHMAKKINQIILDPISHIDFFLLMQFLIVF